jgi:hypothetical protein
VNRCPECGFQYDLPALREIAWREFYATLDPFLSGIRLLAPVSVLGFVSLMPDAVRLNLPFAVLLVVSGRLLEYWVLGLLGQELEGFGWVESLGARILQWGLLAALAVILVGRFGNAVLAGIAIAAGLAWSMTALVRHGRIVQTSQDRVLSPFLAGILDRARWATWCLIAGNLILLGLLILRG